MGRAAAAASEDSEAGRLRPGLHHPPERRHPYRGLRRQDQARQVPDTHSETGLGWLFIYYALFGT